MAWKLYISYIYPCKVFTHVIKWPQNYRYLSPIVSKLLYLLDKPSHLLVFLFKWYGYITVFQFWFTECWIENYKFSDWTSQMHSFHWKSQPSHSVFCKSKISSSPFHLSFFPGRFTNQLLNTLFCSSNGLQVALSLF